MKLENKAIESNLKQNTESNPTENIEANENRINTNNENNLNKNIVIQGANGNALLNNFIQIQQQQQLEYIINELINQQQLQLKLQLEHQIQQYNQIIPNNVDLSLFNNFILRSNTNQNQAQNQSISSPISSNCSTTTESSYPYARIEIDYSNDSASKNFVYFINKKKITIGRKINPSLINSESLKLADILIENSTLVSRHHFSIELKSSRTNHLTNAKNLDFSYIDSEQSDDDEDVHEHDNLSHLDKSKFYYWKLLCTSKNGLFINTRYIQSGKHVRLFNKKYTFRFPNTNIKIYFESMVETMTNCTPSPTLTSMSSNSIEENEKSTEIISENVKKETKTTQSNNNKIAQILMQKQLEQQQNLEIIQKKEELNHDESSNLSNSDKAEVDNCSKKPPYSYAQLIAQAISSSKEQQLTLSQIYQFISSNYSYYKLDDKGWQNSIRHNLSLNRNFVKVARQQNEPGKGSFWRIESSSELKVKEQAYSRKSRSSTPNGMNRIAVQSSPNSSSSSSSLPEANEENEKVQKEDIKINDNINSNQQLLLNLIQNQTSQIPCLAVQPIDQLQAILNNNLNILNSNPTLVQLLYQNLTQNQSIYQNQNLLVIQPQVPQVQAVQIDPKINNSVKLRLLLNDDSNSQNSKRTISQVLNETENSLENAQKKSCQENKVTDNSKLSNPLVVMVNTGLHEKQES